MKIGWIILIIICCGGILAFIWQLCKLISEKIVKWKKYVIIKKRLIYFYIKFDGDQLKIFDAVRRKLVPNDLEIKERLKNINLRDYLIPIDKKWDSYIRSHYIGNTLHMCIKIR